MKSDEVIGSVLSSISGEGLTPNGEPALSADPSVLGNILMGGGDGGDEAVLIVWNPLGSIRTEAVNIPVPICAVRVFDADSGNEIVAQVHCGGSLSLTTHTFTLSFSETGNCTDWDQYWHGSFLRFRASVRGNGHTRTRIPAFSPFTEIRC